MGVTLLKRKGCAKIERQVNVYFTDLCNSYNRIWMDIDRAKVGKSPTDYRQCIELYGSASLASIIFYIISIWVVFYKEMMIWLTSS